MPYNIPVFKNLIKAGYSLYVIQYDKSKRTPFKHDDIYNAILCNMSDFSNYEAFRKYCSDVNPCLIFVCEVMNIWYWKVSRYFRVRNNEIPIVLGSDAQWTGSINNYLKKISFFFTYKKCFTHAMVAGLWQCDYAKKIGFKRNQIIFPLYSANISLYQSVNIENKKTEYPKKFLFIGRFHTNKGLANLFNAWERISDKKGWTLTVVGNGPLEELVKMQKNVEVLDFQSQENIVQIMNNVGCAIVPSIIEPWGLVIHEAAAAGLPIIVTSVCGATNQFVINKYNGFIIPGDNSEQLKKAIIKIIETPNEELINMCLRSRQLSNSITPEIIAQTMLSIID